MSDYLVVWILMVIREKVPFIDSTSVHRTLPMHSRISRLWEYRVTKSQAVSCLSGAFSHRAGDKLETSKQGRPWRKRKHLLWGTGSRWVTWGAWGASRGSPPKGLLENLIGTKYRGGNPPASKAQRLGKRKAMPLVVSEDQFLGLE